MNEKRIQGCFLPITSEVISFLQALASDLRFVGMPCRTYTHRGSVRLAYDPYELQSLDLAKVGGKLRSRQLLRYRVFVSRYEESSLRSLFIDGSEVEIDRIDPKVEVCRTEVDFKIHRYCRLLQTVPSGPRVGRRIAALIYDVGQGRRAIMGAIMLASPLFSVHARDELFGWINRQPIKVAGLRRIMDLSLCMAVPPYNYLLAGKLMATLAVCGTMSREFSQRYRDRLLAVTTTCATGLHCPIFNRIMICKGGLYRRVGETTGYTTTMFSDKTSLAARELIKAKRLASDISGWNTMRVLKTAVRHCGINPEPLLQAGNHKGV